MPGHVFISYSDKDKTFAEMLLSALEKRGTQCWIAPRDIPPGGSYADAIMRAIEECGCFVLVYTVHSNSSSHVLREVERALKFERNIIPVRFDQSEPSRSLDYLLATVHWLSIETSTADTAVSRVANQISACVSPGTAIATASPLRAQVEQTSMTPPIAADSRGVSKFVAAVVVLLIAGTILFTQFVSRKSPPNQASEKTVAQSKSTSQTTPLAERSAHTPARGTPQVILQRYFGCFGERDPSAAYNLLSTSFRSSMSFKKYSAMFSSTREIKVNETNLVNEAENIATVFVRFQETDADYHETYWQGPIEFVREAGEWRIKTLRELKKVAAPEGDVSRPKINVATGPPVRTADKTWERPHVYLQLANESQRTAAVDLKRRLTQLGCDVVEIQSVPGNVDIPSATSELRYFSTGDAAEAQRLANEMQAFFGSTGIIVYLPEGMPYVSHSRQYEVWFSSAFH